MVSILFCGGVAKRTKATVCKTVISWVRIPPPPVIKIHRFFPIFTKKSDNSSVSCVKVQHFALDFAGPFSSYPLS